MKDYFRPELLPLSEPPAGMQSSCQTGYMAALSCIPGGTAGGACIQNGSSPYST